MLKSHRDKILEALTEVVDACIEQDREQMQGLQPGLFSAEIKVTYNDTRDVRSHLKLPLDKSSQP